MSVMQIVSGSHAELTMACVRFDKPFAISPAAVVQAMFWSDITGQEFGPVIVVPSAAGSDWTIGCVVIEFPPTLTEQMPVGNGVVELEIVENGKTSTFFTRHVEVLEGHID